MPSQAKLDAAFAAVTPIVNADIAKGEGLAPVFIRQTVDQDIQSHRAMIDAMVKELLAAGIDAADKIPD